MTNSDTEARQKLYGSDIRGCPTGFVDGKVTDPLGGPRDNGEGSFGKLREAIDKNLEVDDEGSIKLDVKRDGSKITVSAEVSGLKESGAKTKLRLALVEEVVRFQGRNGQRLHHNVVRAFFGGVDGFALEKKEGKHEATLDAEDVKKKLGGQLDRYQAAFVGRVPGFTEWPDRPLRLAKLKVIAFVQDDDGKRILQAAQADVPAK
jgi:hypothetical protein